jgi:hypothetical protein
VIFTPHGNIIGAIGPRKQSRWQNSAPPRKPDTFDAAAAIAYESVEDCL